MITKQICLILVLWFSANAFADGDKIGQIKQVNSQKNLVAVQLEGKQKIAAGDDILVDTGGGKQCTLNVTKVTGKIATASSAGCEEELKVGQKVEKSLIESSPVDEKRSSKEQPAHEEKAASSDLPSKDE